MRSVTTDEVRAALREHRRRLKAFDPWENGAQVAALSHETDPARRQHLLGYYGLWHRMCVCEEMILDILAEADDETLLAERPLPSFTVPAGTRPRSAASAGHSNLPLVDDLAG